MTVKKNQEPERLSFWDTFNSLTGYEEDAIEEAFGSEVGDLTKHTFDGSLSLVGLRAMVFVAARRDGAEDPKAVAQSLTRKELNDRFLSDDEDADDAMPEEPDTELGKDDSAPA